MGEMKFNRHSSDNTPINTSFHEFADHFSGIMPSIINTASPSITHYSALGWFIVLTFLKILLQELFSP